MYSYGPPHMAVQKQDNQHEHTFSSYVRIRDVVLKTCLGRWTLGRSGERGSGISVLPARHDDDDDDDDNKFKTSNLVINISSPSIGVLQKKQTKKRYISIKCTFGDCISENKKKSQFFILSSITFGHIMKNVLTKSYCKVLVPTKKFMI